MAAAVAIVAAPFGGIPTSNAHAACGLFGLLDCLSPPASEPRPSGPDPGGADAPDQPVPAPGKWFGFNTFLYWQESSQSIVDFEVGRAAQLGANVQRLPVDWATFQPTRSSPPLSSDSAHPRGDVPSAGSLRQLDRLYDTARASGIRLLLIMHNAPKWASAYAHCNKQLALLALPGLDGYPPGCEPVRDGKALYPTRDYLPDLERFVTALGQRYPGVMFEVWNEPNWDTGPQAARASFVGEMTCSVHRAAKALPERNLVLSPAFGNFNNGSHATAEQSTRAYLDGFYSTGRGCYDRFSLHTYNGDWPDFGADSPLADAFRIFRDVRSAHEDTTPIWVTEFGFTTTGPTSSDGGVRVDEHAQDDLLGREYNRLVTMPDVEAAISHTLRDKPLPQSPFSNPNDREYGYGWLRGDGSPKPVWCTFAARSGRGSC